jgi:hypothetical protein
LPFQSIKIGKERTAETVDQSRPSRLAHYAAATALFLLLALCLCPPARSDVGVVLNDPLDEGMARITASGHSSVYFSRICPDTPLKLRLCRPGEEGSVLSNYQNYGEDVEYEWNIVPLSVYLYGVNDPQSRTLLGLEKVKGLLEQNYRSSVLADYCSVPKCSENKRANWKDAVGATLARTVYIFIVKTTVDQDLELIAKFNSLPNESHFNAFTNNCANFTKNVIDTYFPNSVHGDFVNDFGMTSPKAVARSFTRYALRHPESEFRIEHYPQIPGDIKRTSDPRSGTEQMYHSPKWLVPMAIFASHEMPFIFLSYNLTGRFNPDHEFEEHPTARTTELDDEIHAAKSEKDSARVHELKDEKSEERANTLGTSDEWDEYREQFEAIVDEAIHDEVIRKRKSLREFARHLDRDGTPVLDDQGNLWVEIQDGEKKLRVGMTSKNIFAPGSDPRLAYELLLAHVDTVLRSHAHTRETIVQFKDNWSLLQQAHAESAGLHAPREKSGSAPSFLEDQ